MRFIYRLMKTVGFNFLNFPATSSLSGFVTIEDMMRARDENRGTNKSNNSTYISKNEDGDYEGARVEPEHVFPSRCG